ncbi:MAG: hypothetical protein KatS3mg023_3303 [Armatimonadota bacterium]|nr:MAG: hypothetical protein KatS3mg023_3303 [Armatimonadota bacterium]
MPPKLLTAEEIIQRCARTYSNARSFTGHTQVSTVLAMPGSPKVQMSAEARIAFVRPGKLRVEGFMMTAMPTTATPKNTFLVVSNGNRSWLKTSLRPQVEESSDVSMHIAAVTGIGLGAPTTLPALLMGQMWGYPLTGTPRLLGRQRVRGMECYKISLESPIGQTTVWIDTSQFLLQRMHQKHDMKAIRNRTPKPPGAQAGSLPEQMEITYEFLEQKVNPPVPETLFRKP